jgi:hypothetical protein
MPSEDGGRAHVVYRASRPSGSVVEIHLAIEARTATVADAWSRLTGVHADLDPMSIEIEVHHGARS